jgi:signal transduction histidine kinase/ActR/RegA family two-component response regulator
MRTPRLALRHVVVLIVVATVGTVIGIHDVAAYRALRASAVDVASGRLRAAVGQIGAILDAQSALLRKQIDTVGRHSAVKAILRSPSNDEARRAALAALQTLNFLPVTSAAMEIVDTAGAIVVNTAGRSPVPESAQRGAIASVSRARPVAVSPGVAVGDTLFYATVARVVEDTTPLGYVLQWRRLTNNQAARQQLIDLIGPGTDLAAGNTTGPGWTDFAKVIGRPPLALPAERATWYTRDGAGERLAVARPITGTPWTLIVDFTEPTVMSGVDSLVRRLVVVTLLLLAAGIAAAWLLARRVTTPLGELASAAAGISAGDYSRRVTVRGPYEVSTLGTAFNTMSGSIDTAHGALKERSEELAERATQLSEQAVELEVTNEELNDSIEEAVRARDELTASLAENKRLEFQLVQSQKMEAVGRLAGGVAHDFNNMLTAITGFGQFALSALGDESADARADLEQVLAAADRAATLTRQLLAFSRQQVLQPRVINLNVVVNGLSPMLARLIGEDIKLVARASPTLSPVKADPHQVEQVLVNLVVNARDAMPDGGTLVIETADVELDASYAASREGVTPGRYVMLAVTDTGIGMDAATRARVFDPFFTTKEPGKGTGLGLSTVYGIVKQSGGNVDLYSEPGRGSTFKVYLPRTDERVDARPTPPLGSVVVTRGRLTVLLVDDDAFVAAAARRALERTGYQVLTASNGRQALGILEQHTGSIDVLVTDLVMPEMGGRELADHVLTARPTVRVLYTSGYTAEAMNQQAVLDPNDAFLGKPFTPDSLLRAVHALIDPAAASSE